MLRSTAARVASLVLILASTALAAPPDDLLTVAERSGFKATARHAEVVALCEALAKSSPLIRLAELGKSGEGRSLAAHDRERTRRSRRRRRRRLRASW